MTPWVYLLSDAMRGLPNILFLCGSLWSLSAAADLSPVTIKGSKFFDDSGDQFFVRGVYYSPRDNAVVYDSETGSTIPTQDMLATLEYCSRDIPYLQKLQTNVITVFAIDSSLDHSSCLQAFNDAGIYVLVDLTTATVGLVSNTSVWSTTVLDAFTAIVDEFQAWDNVLGFLVADGYASGADFYNTMAYVKAAVRDVKAYIKQQGYRAIGVGYAAIDGSSLNYITEYLNCGTESDSVDFIGLDLYSWCGELTYWESGYEEMTDYYANYSVPLIMSQYGCNLPAPRTFTEVAALYSDKMTPVWSGGVVFEYFNSTINYGLVNFDNDTNIELSTDYKNLQAQMASVTPSAVSSDAYTPTNTRAAVCPTTGSPWYMATALPPTPNSDVCACMMSSLNCTVSSPGVLDTVLESLFDDICGADFSACEGLAVNASTGVYGAYSTCSLDQQVAWAMNRYYMDQNSSATACDFAGNATTQTSARATGTCSTYLAQAGTFGNGTLTAVQAAKTAGATSSATSSAAAGGGGTSGETIGIAVGVSVLVVLLLAGAGFLYYRRRKRQNYRAAATADEDDSKWGKPELAGREIDGETQGLRPVMADGNPRYEMGGGVGTGLPAEMNGGDGTMKPAEMAGANGMGKTPWARGSRFGEEFVLAELPANEPAAREAPSLI